MPKTLFSTRMLQTLVLSTLLWTPFCLALQTRPVVDNGSTTANISASQLTKLFVEDDFITDLYVANTNIQTQIDNETGELFLLPQTPLSGQSFTLMIRTHTGHSYTVVATPVNTPAETIMLLPKGAGTKKAARWEMSSNYSNLLIRLLKSMHDGSQPEGYTVTHVNVDKKHYGKLGNIAYLKLLTLYQGKQLTGEVYQIINRTDHSLNLTEREFYQINDRAMALQEMTVAPRGSTILYKERDNA